MRVVVVSSHYSCQSLSKSSSEDEQRAELCASSRIATQTVIAESAEASQNFLETFAKMSRMKDGKF